MIGDSLVDLCTAQQAGTRACLARYGFGFEQCPADAFGGDEVFVDRASDLPEVLQRVFPYR
jgi:phosphoglycolate phosphatase-like HAD superfamily hydrolase